MTSSNDRRQFVLWQRTSFMSSGTRDFNFQTLGLQVWFDISNFIHEESARKTNKQNHQEFCGEIRLMSLCSITMCVAFLRTADWAEGQGPPNSSHWRGGFSMSLTLARHERIHTGIKILRTIEKAFITAKALLGSSRSSHQSLDRVS